MKGDFSRDTFDKSKHYSRVLTQQGRVQTDADQNEQIEIDRHLDRTTRRDVIGYCGGPQGQDRDGNALAGFRIVNRDGKLFITSGRYYVAGILCENEVEVLIGAQPHLPDLELPEGIGKEGSFLAYLDVWERHITALDDPDIREVALGGPDTATRSQVIWQVKLEPVDDGATCDAFGSGWTPPGSASTGSLAARAEPGDDSDGLCLTPEGAGYRRLENQLYRVEIHTAGGADEATFKWSRENGSVVTRWEDLDGDTLIVSSSGRDSYLGFAAGDWVELTDDTKDLNGEPGILVQLATVEGQLLTIDAATIIDPEDPNATSVDFDQFPLNPKVRRWDMSNGPELVNVPAANDGWLKLEDGVEVQFDPAGSYQTGDYCLIPARTALGDLLWPVDETTGEPVFQERMGIEHYYCPLALIAAEGTIGRALIDADGNRDLAESVARSANRPEWTFTLPDDFKLADGTNLVAGVFIEKLNESPPPLTAFGNTEEVDELTLIIRLTQLLPFTGEKRFFEELSAVRVDVASREAQIRDCRSLFPPLTNVGETERRPEAGIHIVKLAFSNGEPLINNAEVPVELLVEGLKIICDAEIDPDSIEGKPTCFVTLEMPYPLDDADFELWGDGVIGFQPLKLAANVITDSESIVWKPGDITGNWLQNGFRDVVPSRTGLDSVLAHLTLKGNFIWTPTDPKMYLDGEALGTQPPSDHNLILPSGDDRTGGDFEMWFWLSLN